MNRFKVLFLLSFVFIVGFSQQNKTLDPYNPSYEPNVILVKFKDNVNLSKGLAKGVVTTSISGIDQLNRTYQVESMEKVFRNSKPRLSKPTFKDPSGEIHEVPNLDKIYKLKYKADIDPKEVIKEYQSNPEVEYAEPDYHVYAMMTPDDPLYQSGDQWYIDAVNAPAAWDSSNGEGQIISIIDTGVDWDHSDLDNNIWINQAEADGVAGFDDDGNGYVDDIRGWDFVNDDNDPNDDNSHGTHVAGIAAAESNNGVGITGIAWNSRIMPVKMLQSSGQGSSSDLAEAIDYAAQNGATVINMSLGSYGESQTVKIALENAYACAVLVAAAGNNGYKVDPPFPPLPIYAPMYPACYGFVIGVEASKQNWDEEYGWLASFSNFDPSGPVNSGNRYGHNYEIRAPGVSIYSTFPNGNYNSLNGTSMAAPIVAGALALMKSYNPSQSTEKIFARLIQGANNGILDIRNSLNYELEPDLHFLEYTIVDTLPGCDRDGIADAGETIEIYLTVKNAGGCADSVCAKLRFGEFEDTSTANIIDSASYIGDISEYATLTGELHPFRIEIDPDIVNNRDIVFEYEIGAKNYTLFTGEFIITVQNGEEIGGLIDYDLTLTSDRVYIVTQSLAILPGFTLTIKPGTVLRFNDNMGLVLSGNIVCEGKKDSMIVFTNNQNYWGGVVIDQSYFNPYSFKFCLFEGITGEMTNGVIKSATSYTENINIINCVFKNNNSPVIWDEMFNVYNTNFYDNQAFYGTIIDFRGIIQNCNIINNSVYYHAACIMNIYKNNYYNNNIFNNYCSQKNADINIKGDVLNGFGYCHIPEDYYGTNEIEDINDGIWDYFDDASVAVVVLDSILERPSPECHGIVWKVEINNILVNKYDNPYGSPTGLGPVGSETIKFDVYFNRAMDTTYTPFLTFGVREPYTQHVVHENASWSSDSTIWTAYYDVGLETGDGIQTIRVANAKDDEHFEIPIEDSRFKFVIQAAGAASVEFIATPGIGKVDLEWPTAESPDVLGYNIYRFKSLTDSTFNDTLMINPILVTDTTFTDFNVIPDSTYRYLYSVVGTDMQESDYSKSISATPFSAANGDANGDLAVNVLDIISIVNYMLQKDPEPFLFDAADINGDDAINVLDIISVVSIILEGEGTAKLASADNATEAIFSLDKDRLKVSSNGLIGGYQFRVTGNIDNLQITSLYPMEVATADIDENSKLVVIYSLKGECIPKGNHDVMAFSVAKGIKISDLVVASRSGEQVVAKIGEPGETLLPEKFALGQNYPNPFNNTTMIKYNVPEISDITIRIYNLMGQVVSVYNVKQQAPGYYHYQWDGRNLNGQIVSSGIYFYQMKAKGFIDTKKMVLLK